MKRIITDLAKLKTPAEQLKFMTETGLDRAEGDEIINQLTLVMEKHSDLLALSAPQIGIHKRVFVIRFNDSLKFFINPIMKKKGAGLIRFETNASLPNKEIAICRPQEIEVGYFTNDFKYEDNKLLGAAAAIFTQQYELLDGIIPGETSSLFNRAVTLEDVAAIIACEYSGDGIVAEIQAEEDRFTSDDVSQIAEILSKQQEVFKTIGTALLHGENTELKALYKNLKYLDKVCLGEIVPIAENDQHPMNREQRRAAAKAAKKAKVRR